MSAFRFDRRQGHVARTCERKALDLQLGRRSVEARAFAVLVEPAGHAHGHAPGQFVLPAFALIAVGPHQFPGDVGLVGHHEQGTAVPFRPFQGVQLLQALGDQVVPQALSQAAQLAVHRLHGVGTVPLDVEHIGQVRQPLVDLGVVAAGIRVQDGGGPAFRQLAVPVQVEDQSGLGLHRVVVHEEGQVRGFGLVPDREVIGPHEAIFDRGGDLFLDFDACHDRAERGSFLQELHHQVGRAGRSGLQFEGDLLPRRVGFQPEGVQLGPQHVEARRRQPDVDGQVRLQFHGQARARIIGIRCQKANHNRYQGRADPDPVGALQFCVAGQGVLPRLRGGRGGFGNGGRRVVARAAHASRFRVQRQVLLQQVEQEAVMVAGRLIVAGVGLAREPQVVRHVFGQDAAACGKLLFPVLPRDKCHEGVGDLRAHADRPQVPDPGRQGMEERHGGAVVALPAAGARGQGRGWMRGIGEPALLEL